VNVLDEKSLRKPEFAADSVAVRMADGQDWYLPKPWVALAPVVKNGRVVSLGSRTMFGPEFDALVDAVGKAEADLDTIAAVFAVAVDLIGRNYAIPDVGYEEILRYRSDDDISRDTLVTIMEIARGNGPKRSTDGGSSA
jgi:hypothetical protein